MLQRQRYTQPRVLHANLDRKGPRRFLRQPHQSRSRVTRSQAEQVVQHDCGKNQQTAFRQGPRNELPSLNRLRGCRHGFRFR